MIGKLRMMRSVADDLGREDFTVTARTDARSAMDASEPARGLERGIDRACRYLDSGVPDLVWCEFPTSDRGPTERFASEVRKSFPDARFAFNWSSSFKWFNDADPITFAQLGELGYKFLFITLAAQHAYGYGFAKLLQGLRAEEQQAYVELQKKEGQGRA